MTSSVALVIQVEQTQIEQMLGGRCLVFFFLTTSYLNLLSYSNTVVK